MNLPRFVRLGSVTLLLAQLAPLTRPAEFSSSLREPVVPAFDPSGRMIRRLTAQSADLTSTFYQLHRGKVEFFAPADSSQRAVTLEFDEARAPVTADRVEGDGALVLTTGNGIVRARGFDGALDTGVFVLKSAVQLNTAEFQLNGDRGDLRFDPAATKADRAIRSAALTGNVVLTGAAATKKGFDRIETALARYDAAQSKIFVKLPLTGWKNGEHGLLEAGSEFLEIDLPPSSAAPAP